MSESMRIIRLWHSGGVPEPHVVLQELGLRLVVVGGWWLEVGPCGSGGCGGGGGRRGCARAAAGARAVHR
jgi:hypothetical protein